MALLNEHNVVAQRGLSQPGGPAAGTGQICALDLAGTGVALNVLAPPGGGNEGSGQYWASSKSITRFSKPGSPGAGPGTWYWIGNKIFVLSAPPASTLAFTVTSQRSANDFRGNSGLQFLNSRGKNYLAGMAPGITSTNHVVVVWLELDNVTAGWQQKEYGPFSVASTTDEFAHAMSYQGTLIAASYRDVFTWTPGSQSLSHSVVATTAISGCRFSRLVECRGRLFWVGAIGNGPTGFVLVEKTGGAWHTHYAIGKLNHDQTGKFGVIVLGTDVFTWHWQDDSSGGFGGVGWIGSRGVRHFRHAITSATPGTTPTLTNHDGVVPIQWKYKTEPQYGGFDLQIRPMQDNTNPSSGSTQVRSLHIWAQGLPLATVHVYNGPLAAATDITGASTKYQEDLAFPIDDAGSGHRTFTAPAVTLESAEQLDDGNVKLSFFLVDNTGTGNSVAFYYAHPANASANEGGPQCYKKCLLLAGSVTGVDQFATPATLDAVNNRVLNVTAENNAGPPGPTLYTVIWDLSTQGALLGWGDVQAVREP